MKKVKISEKELNKALYKRALGYEANEVVEEYSVDESGDYILNKRKITKKHISPDLSAAKLLLEKYSDKDSDEIKNMTKQEIYEKKLQLLELLEKSNK
jgi:hypothetical protein